MYFYFQVLIGGLNYVKEIRLKNVYSHLKFVYVKLFVQAVHISSEDGVIRVRFSIRGWTAFKLFFNYIPKKLYKSANMKKAPVYLDAVSTYHVDKEGKIFRHVLDNKDEDKGMEKVKSTVEQVKEKLQKLGEKVPSPSPAL